MMPRFCQALYGCAYKSEAQCCTLLACTGPGLGIHPPGLSLQCKWSRTCTTFRPSTHCGQSPGLVRSSPARCCVPSSCLVFHQGGSIQLASRWLGMQDDGTNSG